MVKEETKQQCENFAYNVAVLRKRRGLSKSEMAQLVGTTVESLERMEREEMPRIGLKVLLRVMEEFSVSADFLLNYRLEK